MQSSKGIQCLRKSVVHIAQLELIPYPLLCGKNVAEFHGSTRRCVLDDVHTAPVTTCLVLIYSVSSIMEYLTYNDRSNRDFRGGQNCQSSQSCHCPHCVSYDRPPRTCSFVPLALSLLVNRQVGFGQVLKWGILGGVGSLCKPLFMIWRFFLLTLQTSKPIKRFPLL